MITDEMVEKAVEAANKVRPDYDYGCDEDMARAALETIAPMLIAQAMLEAAGICEANWAPASAHAIRLRAQEIDPK